MIERGKGWDVFPIQQYLLKVHDNMKDAINKKNALVKFDKNMVYNVNILQQF